jgi:hypothetical protein
VPAAQRHRRVLRRRHGALLSGPHLPPRADAAGLGGRFASLVGSGSGTLKCLLLLVFIRC